MKWALWIVMGIGLAGCAGKAELTPEERGMSQGEIDAMIRGSVSRGPFEASQKDVGLVALAKRGGRVQVTLTNKTRRTLEVGPQMFGLIRPGERKVVPSLSGSRHLFPMTRVSGGDSASGLIEFPAEVVSAGARVVFACPGVEPAMAELEMGR